jgi:hypothetical protein
VSGLTEEGKEKKGMGELILYISSSRGNTDGVVNVL